MIKIYSYLAILLFNSFYSPVYASTYSIIKNPASQGIQATLEPSAKLISFNASVKGNKITLYWVVNENETANLFEVQKSLDGKNFELAALVFGSEKQKTDKYSFYEKKNSDKILYRIKLINKNKEIEYSTVLTINTKNN